jgi:hypothetical protein
VGAESFIVNCPPWNSLSLRSTSRQVHAAHARPHGGGYMVAAEARPSGHLGRHDLSVALHYKL